MGRDVVLHEFAHKLDMRDGVVDGTPLIDDADRRQRGSRSARAEYERRPHRTDRSLRSYAATNPGEFFAVATETFFTVPLDLRSLHPDLYEVLQRLLPPGPGGPCHTFASGSWSHVATRIRTQTAVSRG